MNAPRPRVIFVNRVYRPSTSATAQLLADLAEGLASAGLAIHVIAAGQESGTLNAVQIHRTGPGDLHAGLLSRASNYLRFIRQAHATVGQLIAPGDIVVPMTDPPMLGTALGDLVQSRGGTVVQWLQDLYPEIAMAHAGPVLGLPLQLLQRRRDASVRAAARCVVLGNDMARVLGRRGLPMANVVIQPNWAPRELGAEPDPMAVAARRRLWGVEDKFVVAYSGNLGRVHEFDTVLGAAERLASRTDIAFVFVGDGARLAEVRKRVAQRRLAHVRLEGAVPRGELAVSLAAADAHLVTLKPEFDGLVFPSKLAGALASGRPVLFTGSSTSEIARLLDGSQCGSAITAGDDAALAATIGTWAADRALVRDLGSRARSMFAEHFTFPGALQRWKQILGDVAGSSQRGCLGRDLLAR
ncbi:MAG TPA: glycosyltransferase family 4 protein [Lacunisphaera sp.]|nr:glycosyltransferase family 4 protein [Lacunisphaera sp.]